MGLQTCMTSPKANQVAVCRMGSDRRNLRFIEVKENEIKWNEDIVQASKRKMQEHQEFLKEMQEFIKKKQMNIEDLLDALDMRKQVKENEIKENEDIVQASERKMQEHQELLKETQDIIKKKQENIADLQDVLDMRKQNIVYLKQIFEGLSLHAGV